jgi:hypothetical protein
MRKMQLCTWAVAIAGLTACTVGPSLTTTGPHAPSSRPLPCEFQLLTVVPSGSYVERGAFDFKQEVAPYVCRAGGDIALAQANRDGIYVRATILKATAAALPTGCAFDTQCKGQRVCVKGECVDPPR